ncbi:MAG TPA: ribosome maturation factor RimM [Candidatus Rubrimentiphilum sp.]|nr:ribosome maturation factor RimM [Candidatus Rubrimentiphilum sp.]
MKARSRKTRPSDELPVGRIAGLFGVKGELKCDPTNAGRMLFEAGQVLRAVLAGGVERELRLATVREHKGRLLVTFEGAASADEAEKLAGATLYADRSRIELKPDEYLDRDLIGCAVRDASGTLGVVERVDHYPGSDMLVVNGKMIPLVQPFITAIDVGAKRIDVDLPAGLLDD